MKWIRYEVMQSINGEEPILITKRIPYNSKNLAIALNEAYDGHSIVEDSESFNKEPLGIPFGGTGADTAKKAIESLGIYPVGSVVITSTSDNPKNNFGGTWECFDKHLAYKTFDSSKAADDIWTQSSAVKHSYVFAVVEGHSVRFRFNILTAVQIGETDTLLGTIDYVKMGFGTAAYSVIYEIGASEGGDAMGVVRLDFETGELHLMDINPKLDGKYLAAGSNFYVHIDLPISTAAMFNRAVDKFYWKRIA